MNVHKWLRVIVSLGFAGAMIVIFGIIAYKLIGTAGIAGAVVVALGILINGYITKVEDSLSDDLRGSRSSPEEGTAKR